MKKFILAAIVLVGMTAQTFAGPIITIKVRIGKKSSECAGFGWCGGTIGAELTTSNATIQFDERNNQLIWEVSYAAMKGKESFIQQNQIKIEEEAEIEADILRALKTLKPLTIKAGSYPVEKTEFGYKIIIKQ